MKYPFHMFSMEQLLYLFLVFIAIVLIVRRYGTWDASQQGKFQKMMAIYFLVEEGMYTLWLLLNCHNHVWLQILPLELCSLCVYVNAAAVFTKKKTLRFFGAVVGLVAGGVALLYPANIAGLYPSISYRVINFYMLHGSFILFALIQLRDRDLLQYAYLKKNTMIIACMISVAFVVNLMLKTQYMFVGVPPKISFIASLYQLTGIVFFLPVVLVIVCSLQFPIVFLLRRMYQIKT